MDNKYTNTDIFKITECPSDTLLLSYVKDTISKEDKRLVELHLIDCEMCSDMVEGYERMDPKQITSNIKSIESKIDQATASHNNKKFGAASFKWYYAAAAVLIIGLTGILYNFYFKSLDESQVADLPNPNQNEISLMVDSTVKEGVQETEINPEAKVIKSLEPIYSEDIESKNTRKPTQEETLALSESSMDVKKPAPLEQNMGAQPTETDDAAMSTKSLTDNTTFGNATIVQPTSVPPSTEVLTNSATATFTSPSSNLNEINIIESDSKKFNFSVKKESAAKGKNKANVPAAAKEQERDKQKDMAIEEKVKNDESIILQEANLLLQQENYKEALLKFNQYLKLHPKSCEAVNGAAQSYEFSNNISDAIIYYNRLTQLNCGKTSDMAYLKLGSLYLKNNQSEEAKSVLKKAMQSKYLDVAEQAKKELDKL